jgi:peptidoglycan/LPS O-acetylase OafA/YrhL
MCLARLYSKRSSSPTPVDSLYFGALGLATQFSLLWLIVSPASCPFPFDRWYQFGLGALLFQLVAAGASTGSERKAALAQAWRQMGVAGLLTILFAICHDLYGSSGHPSTRMQAFAALAFLILLWILHPQERRLAQWKILHPVMWLGTISYSLYLTHTIALPFVTTGLRKLGFDTDWYIVTFLIQIAISILGGWIFYLAVERHFISSRQKKRVVEELKEPA